jgi:hypothetical protein
MQISNELPLMVVIMTGYTLIKYQWLSDACLVAFPAIHSFVFAQERKVCFLMIESCKISDRSEGFLRMTCKAINAKFLFMDIIVTRNTVAHVF